jgi:hypothetical protein
LRARLQAGASTVIAATRIKINADEAVLAQAGYSAVHTGRAARGILSSRPSLLAEKITEPVASSVANP